MRTNILVHFYYVSLLSSWNENYQTKVVEKIKTHILYSVTFFFEIL